MTTRPTQSSPTPTTDETEKVYDILIVGGGVNGAGIARDAAGRGLSVYLCEQDDLAKYTSSSSSKLIHGGLRYLELYDFKLVRHSLQEREVLLRSAPHIIWPLRFVLPHHKELRPRWLIRLGLFLYDHLGKRKILPASKGLDLCKHVSGKALKQEFTHGFEYSDCWVQDARLVALNAQDAHEHGASINTRTKCISLDRGEDEWKATIKDCATGERKQVRAKSIVNAAGPWVEQVAGLDSESQSAHGVRLVKGSHVVVPKLFDHEYVYIFQNADGRIMFAIPYEQDFTLLGTTDVEITGNPGQAAASDEEVDYICKNASQYFEKPIDPKTVTYRYTGVRPLFDDAAENASKTTRDYVLHLDDKGPPIVSIYGGKITTYRKLSEEVVDMLSEPLGYDKPTWTENSTLPGGDIVNADFDQFKLDCIKQYSWCDSKLVSYLTRNYGTKIHVILAEAKNSQDLGRHFGYILYEVEVNYLMQHEWAKTTEDILWRRTKLGLHLTAEETTKLAEWLTSKN